MASQSIQKFLDIWQGPALSFGTVVEPIVGNTLAVCSFLLHCEGDWGTPRAVELDNLASSKLLLHVRANELQLLGCKALDTRTVERTGPRFEIDFMFDNVCVTEFFKVVCEAITVLPQEGLGLFLLGGGEVRGEVNLFHLFDAKLEGLRG